MFLSRMFNQAALLFLLSATATVHSFPGGAPANACTDIYPVGHPGDSQDLDTSPFQLNISDFDETYGGEFYYVPGGNYTCEIELPCKADAKFILSLCIKHTLLL